MRKYPYNQLSQLNSQPWQLEVLKLNPDYTSWGVYEDYMSKTGNGWDCAQFFQTWSAFGPWTLDSYNEVVNFYFQTTQPHHQCPTCCPECDDETVYEPVPAITSLQLWFLHPRKGSSRGVFVESIQESELESILAYLTVAATRNADRFSKLETYQPTYTIGL
jgi:hypothetical protein